jgi:hypothetical protein
MILTPIPPHDTSTAPSPPPSPPSPPTGTPVNYEEAQALCETSGGALAGLASAKHNLVTKKLLQGQTGWLGLVAASHPAGYTWRWDGYAAWEADQ